MLEWGGQVMSQEPCPNILCGFICLNVWWHPAGIRHVPVRSCQRRVRNALPERNCPNTSPSAVSPLSCQDQITSHGFIYFFHHAPDHHPAPALSCVSLRCPKTKKALGKLLREPSGGRKERLQENTSHSSLIISFSCRQEAPAIRLPIRRYGWRKCFR